MNLIYISIYISILIWAVIPFRQLGKQYFYYFFLNAIVDPIVLFLRIVFHSTSNYLYLPITILILYSVQIKNINKNKLLFSFLFIICSLIGLNNEVLNNIFLIIGIIHLIIFLVFIKDFIIIFVNKDLVNVFLVILSFYEITIITKDFNLLTGITDANIYFAITTIFEILFGLFFCVFRSDDNRLLLQLK